MTKTVVYDSVDSMPRAEKPRYPRFDDLSGRRFTRLTVLHFAGLDKRNRPLWACQCSCKDGSLIVVLANSLKSGTTKSCSCLSRESARDRHITHGLTAHGRARYIAQACWDAMARCNNPQHAWYHRYGGRGIKVLFSGIEEFAECVGTLGPRPNGYSLDRVDNDGHYAAGNLRWASKKEQNRNKCDNRLIVYEGKQVTVAEAIELSGAAGPTLRARLSRGVPDAEALNTPVPPGRFVDYADRRLPLKAAAKLAGLGYETVLYRLSAGWSEYDALHTPARQMQARLPAEQPSQSPHPRVRIIPPRPLSELALAGANP